MSPIQAHGGEDAIKHHPFFRDVKWKELEERKVKPPFKPKFVSLCLAIYKHLLTFCLAEEPERGNKFWYRIYKRGPCSYSCQPRNYQNHPTGENNNWDNWNQLFLISGRVWRVQFLKLSIWKAVNPASEEALRLFRADCFFQVSTAPMFWKVLRVLSWLSLLWSAVFPLQRPIHILAPEAQPVLGTNIILQQQPGKDFTKHALWL